MTHTNRFRGRADVLARQYSRAQRRRRSAIILGVAVFVLGLACLAQAAEFSCPAGDVACLVNAINTANANGEENTILLEIGFYTASVPFDAGFRTAVAFPEITSTLTIEGASGILTVVERASNAPTFFRLFTVGARGKLTLANLTLQGGIAPGPGSGGGGVLNNGGILTVVNSVIKRNAAGPGNACGGISSSGTLTIVGSTITENGGDVSGGLCGAATLILNSSILANGASFGGGGIGVDGPLTVQNSTIAHNQAKDVGGAGVLAFGPATFINSTIVDNSNLNSQPGAGIAIGSNGGPVTLINTIVARNQNRTVPGGALA